MIWYCSRKCQKTDWREHRPECKAWTSGQTGRMPTQTLRLAGRILHAMNRSENDHSASQVREAVGELVHHNDERTPEQQEEYRLMAAFVARMCVAGSRKQALSWPSACDRGFPGLVDAAYSVLGKVSCNVFAVVLEVESCIAGCALYLEASTANHSCSPNAVQSFDDRVLSLRCIRPILKGEEVTVGVIQLHRHSAARQQSLRESYFFECRCDRCTSEGAGAEDARLTGYTCLDKCCPGVCVSRGLGSSRERSPSTADEEEASSAANTLPETRDTGCLMCSICGAPRSAEDAESESRAIEELFARGMAFCSGGKGLEGKLVLEEALQRGTKCLHRGNWVLTDLFAELSSTCLHLQDFEAATKYALNGMGAHKACFSGLPQYCTPWVKRLAIVGKLLLVLGQRTEARPLLEEAVSSIRITHGDQHPYYREVRSSLDQAKACG
ncbi:unnamed protein product [Laminaria digitata]